MVTKNDRVVGVVSEADVLRKEERRFRRLVSGLSGRARRERAKAEARPTRRRARPSSIMPDRPIRQSGRAASRGAPGYRAADYSLGSPLRTLARGILSYGSYRNR